MATQSSSTSVGVGSSNEPTILEVIETTRNKHIWKHYDLCKMSDGSQKGRCKLCASESAFSLSGRGLLIRRTRLTPASLKMCICLKDHLDAQEPIQHTSNLEGDCLEIEQQLLEVEAEAGYVINIVDEEIVLEEQAMSGSGFGSGDSE
nr:zinc finger, BED-type, phospholipase-like, homeodomain-like protein [Tanacetum cinerariifolium]GEZ79984.1 zinc finger, BED-type, phospholipase-like, homeodomain-like protein [Tanacetum cinerariifolium]